MFGCGLFFQLSLKAAGEGKQAGNFLASFLYRGFSFAILQSSGNKDNEIERLTRSVMGEAKTGAPSFRNLPVRLSIPALFAGFSCFKSLRMVGGATGTKEKFLPLKFSFL